MYLWDGYVLLLWVEVTLHFLEMVAQHVQPIVLQGSELPFPGLVTVIVIGVVDFGGSVHCLSLALTSVFVKLSDLFRLRHGLGTFLSSWPLGLRIFLSALVFKSGV